MVRGDVYAIPANRRRGHVQQGSRFAVIVQTDALLVLSTVVICPTSSSAPGATFHPEIALGDERTRVLCEMVGAVDARNLGEQVGHLTLDELHDVDRALEFVLGL